MLVYLDTPACFSLLCAAAAAELRRLFACWSWRLLFNMFNFCKSNRSIGSLDGWSGCLIISLPRSKVKPSIHHHFSSFAGLLSCCHRLSWWESGQKYEMFFFLTFLFSIAKVILLHVFIFCIFLHPHYVSLANPWSSPKHTHKHNLHIKLWARMQVYLISLTFFFQHPERTSRTI